jgi:elongation factor G
MKSYPTDKIRNVALCGGSGAGKTQLSEAILFSQKITNRFGKVDEGNTVSDYDPVEKERRSSINSSLISFESGDFKINLLDTPGYSDFFGSVISAIEVCELVLLVINPHEGIDVSARKIWEKAKECGKSVAVYIGYMDNFSREFSTVLEELKTKISPNIAPLFIPVGTAENYKGVIDLIEGRAVIDGSEQEVPGDLTGDVEAYSESLMDSVAAADDNLMEKFLEEGKLSGEEIRKGLLKGLLSSEIVPVICGSSVNAVGVEQLVSFISNYAPSMGDVEEIDNSNGFKGLIFKSEAQLHVGQVSYMKVKSGAVSVGDTVYNVSAKEKVRLNQLVAKLGDENIKIDKVDAGDICALIKVDGLSVNDTVASTSSVEECPKIVFPVTVVERGVYPKTKGEEEKVANAFSNIISGDPTLNFGFNGQTKEMVLSGLGSLQLELVVKKIRERYNAEVDLTNPKIEYKETIRTKVEDVRGKHKKQTGGKGQYGDCVIRMMPVERGEGFQFEDQIVGGRIPGGYIPSIEKGIVDAMEKGVIAGYPVVDLRVELYDGSYHDVDSSDMAFQLAGSKAFQLAMAGAQPYILEPIMKAAIKVSNDYTGAVMGDLNSRRGRVLGMEPSGDYQVINALVPKEALTTYADDLKSITSGEGEFSMEFDHYEEAPSNVQQALINKYNREKEEGR